MHFNRLKVTLSHFGKSILKLDNKAYMTFMRDAGLYDIWVYVLKKANVAAKNDLLTLVAPIVSYGTEIFETRRRAAKYCAMKAEAFEREWVLKGYTNIQSVKQMETINGEKKLSAQPIQSTNLKIEADSIATFPPLEQALPQNEMRARSNEKQCMDNCNQCNSEFSAINRKHHCRKCGDLVCVACAPNDNLRPVPEYGYLDSVRVCLKCFNPKKNY